LTNVDSFINVDIDETETETEMKFTSLYYNIIISCLVIALTGCGAEISGNTTPKEQVSFSVEQASFEQIDLSPGVNKGKIKVIKYQTEVLEVDYTIFVPQLSDDEKLPLVVGLHGRGQSADHLIRHYLTPALSDLEGIIFGIDAPENGDWLDDFSVILTKQLIEMAISHWPVDENKVVLTGYSMGGTGTWNILTKYRHLFSAAIPIASTPQPWVEEPAANIPLYVIHGENDTFFPLADIQTAVNDLIARGADVEFVIIPAIQHEEIFKTTSYLYETVDWLKTHVWQE